MIGFREILMILGTSSPALLLWIAVVVLAAVWLKRGGGRAERFIIAGAAIKIIGNLLTIPLGFMSFWLIDAGYSMDYANSITTTSGIFLKVVSMVGFICIIYAFWVKFREKNTGAAPEVAA